MGLFYKFRKKPDVCPDFTGIDSHEKVEELLVKGEVNGHSCEPQYRDKSFVPCAVKVAAQKDGADRFTETIHIW